MKFSSASTALVKQHLTPDIMNALSSQKTRHGFTLEKAVASGLANPDSSIGIYAGDQESYTLFDPIFRPVIRAYHGIEAPSAQTDNAFDKLHEAEFSFLSLPPMDPENRFILSTRIRVARNLADLAFPPNMTESGRIRVQEKVQAATRHLPGDLNGAYTPFSSLDLDTYRSLVAVKLAFPKGDRFQDAAGINRDFPVGRGLFLSQDKEFRIWVNEEDHLRIMVLSETSDIACVFNRLGRALEILDTRLAFAQDPDLGFLSSCPTNIGTAMRASVHIRLEKMEKHITSLETIAGEHHLQIRGTFGEKTSVDNAVFDISNARRLGVSANQIARDLYKGVTAIIAAEKSL